MADSGKKAASCQTREALSALLDDEANELDIQRLLSSDMSDIRQQALDYRKAGAGAPGGNAAFADVDLSASISAAIADEPVPEREPEKRGGARWPLWGLGGAAATAACAALVLLVGVDGQTGSDTGSPVARQDSSSQPSSSLPDASVVPYRVQAGGENQDAVQPQVAGSGLQPEFVESGEEYAIQDSQVPVPVEDNAAGLVIDEAQEAQGLGDDDDDLQDDDLQDGEAPEAPEAAEQ